MEKSIFLDNKENKTLGGLSKEEKAARKETKKTKNLSLKEVCENQSQNNADLTMIVSAENLINKTNSEQSENTKNYFSKIKKDEFKEIISKLKLFIKITVTNPGIHRDFLMLLPELEDKRFDKYALQAFKALELNKRASWRTQSAIAYDIFERSRLFRSKGGRGTKGKGLGIRFEEECAKLGINSETQLDNIKIYTTFVVNPTLTEPDPKIRRKRQLDILDSLNLNRCFYFRATRAQDPDKAIELAKSRLEETGGQYTEKQFMAEISRSKRSTTATDNSETMTEVETPTEIKMPTDNEEEVTFSLDKLSISYLKGLAVKWKMSVDAVLDYLIKIHRQQNNPAEVIVR